MGENKVSTLRKKIPSEDQLIADIRKLVDAGVVSQARDVARVGLKNHPESERLRSWQVVLEPPRVRAVHKSGQNLSQKMPALSQSDIERLAGRWVAFDNGSLVADAANYSDLQDLIRDAGQILLVFYVLQNLPPTPNETMQLKEILDAVEDIASRPGCTTCDVQGELRPLLYDYKRTS